MSDRKIEVELSDIMVAKFYFNWSGRGFGQYSLGVESKELSDGKNIVITGSRECMSKESLRQGCHAALDAIFNALPDDDKFGDDFFEVVVPIPAEVLKSREEWERRLQGSDEDQSTSGS